jgi:hypothetical protein
MVMNSTDVDNVSITSLHITYVGKQIKFALHLKKAPGYFSRTGALKLFF